MSDAHDSPLPPAPRRPRHLWHDLARYGLREPLLRLGSHLAVLAVVAVGVWGAREGLDLLPPEALQRPGVAEAQEADPAAPVLLAVDDLPAYGGAFQLGDGILRQSDPHTVLPDRPRLEIIRYSVQPGDSVFGIAERFAIRPSTVMWGNYETLRDNPHALQPGMELVILPVDGTAYTWNAGDGLNGVARFFGVSAQDIIDWPGNELPQDIDLTNPPIDPGTLLIIPGGQREFITWSAPRITRANPGVARILGPGACGVITDGPVGSGSFTWPTNSRHIGGFDYNPGANHPAIDISGGTGHPIYAADSGVVVYSGWNDWGYGLVIVLDHGNGWQTLYAHLSQINVVCGQAVFQGNVIGLMGSTGNSTGPHLHFEIMHDQYGKVNPHNYLP